MYESLWKWYFNGKRWDQEKCHVYSVLLIWVHLNYLLLKIHLLLESHLRYEHISFQNKYMKNVWIQFYWNQTFQLWLTWIAAIIFFIHYTEYTKNYELFVPCRPRFLSFKRRLWFKYSISVQKWYKTWRGHQILCFLHLIKKNWTFSHQQM